MVYPYRTPLTKTSVLVMSIALLTLSGAAESKPLYGFTAFPYDLTAEAVDRVNEIIANDATLYAIHLDQCLPWRESLSGKPFPQWLTQDFNDIRSRIPATHTVYVAVTPTGIDRHTLAPQCGQTNDQAGTLPLAIQGATFDHTKVKQAYVNYVRRIIQQFNPRYINIGIEMSELALAYPAEWPRFQSLYLHALTKLKASFPTVQFGMEFVLQSLMLPAVANLVKPVVNRSDYIGISFYPYGSAYGELMGAPALPNPPEQWRTPLNWLRSYTSKPIAICETGYTTEDFVLQWAGIDIPFSGNMFTQQQLVRDLVDIAKRDQYAFVTWFVPVDYDKLLAKIPGPEWFQIWVNTGLFDSSVQPKPAWTEWQRFAE